MAVSERRLLLAGLRGGRSKRMRENEPVENRKHGAPRANGGHPSDAIRDPEDFAADPAPRSWARLYPAFPDFLPPPSPESSSANRDPSHRSVNILLSLAAKAPGVAAHDFPSPAQGLLLCAATSSLAPPARSSSRLLPRAPRVSALRPGPRSLFPAVCVPAPWMAQEPQGGRLIRDWQVEKS